jgi:dolichyl-phosphate beta-glucosyltransferase
LELLEERILEAEAKGQDCIAIGSRAHLVSTEAVVKRSAIRNFLMYAFHTFVFLLSSPGVRGIKDTQCGFKMFSRSTARKIFPFMHVEGWIFDIEVLHLASSKRIRIDEVAINWQEVEGSKMNLITDSLKMAVDLFVIRFNYATGRWSYKFPQRRKSE